MRLLLAIGLTVAAMIPGCLLVIDRSCQCGPSPSPSAPWWGAR